MIGRELTLSYCTHYLKNFTRSFMLVVVTSLASLSDKYLNVNLQFRMRTFFQFNFIHFVNHRRWEENLFIIQLHKVKYK